MIKIKTNKQLNIIFILLAFILAVMFTFIRKQDYKNVAVELKEIQSATKYQIQYHELEKDSLKEILIQEAHESTKLHSILVYKFNGVIEEQYNFFADDFDEKQLTFTDLNNDGTEELLFLYKRNDSLFTSVIDHKKRKFLIEEELVLTRPKQKIFSNDWDLTIYTGGVTFNNNNEASLVFSIWAGYSILPRGIYSYNIVNKSLKKFEFGAAVHQLVLMDLFKNGRKEIIAASAASGNTWRLNPRPMYDDFSSWLFILNQNLDSIAFIENKGQNSFIEIGFNKNLNLFCKLYTPSSEQSLNKINYQGKILNSLHLNPNKQYLLYCDDKSTNRILLICKDTLKVFDAELKQTGIIVNKYLDDGGIFFFNLDDDPENEIFYTDQNKFLIIDDDLEIIKKVDRKLNNAVVHLNFSAAEISPGKVKIAEDGYHTRWEYEITNIERYYLIPLYLFSFFFGSLVLIFLIKYLMIKSSIIISYFLSSTNRSQDAIMIFGNKLNLVFANKSAFRMFNSKYSFWLNKKNTLAETDKELLELIKETLNGNRRKTEILSVQKNDKYLKYKCTAIPLKAPWKLNIAAYIRLEDISKQIINERQKVLAHSVQKVAHEIKTPLASILLNLDSAEENINTGSEDLLLDIKTARQEIYRIRNFINSFLKLSSIHLPTFQPIKAESLINNALLRFTAYMSRNIKIDLTGDLQENVLCDAFQIEEALQVFIENAIDAMNGEGKIIIHCCKEAVNKKHYLQFNISDEGSGIDEKIINSLFDPYTTTKMHGSGMGLAIAKKILEDHNCKIEIKPNDGRGTIIVFKLIIAD